MKTNSCEWNDALTPEILDRMDILAMIDIYVAGLKSGRVDVLKQAFHEKAVMNGFSTEDKFSEGGIQRLYDVIEKNGPLANVTAENTVLHQTTNTALVLAELKNTSPNQNSTDHLSMIRVDGRWKIISKVYHLSNSN